MAKSGRAEFQKRIFFVYGLMLQGFQRKLIIQHASTKFKVTTRQVDTYIKNARKIFQDDQKIEIETKRSEILSQYYHLYQQCYDQEDFKECKSILKEISDIVGVKPIKVLEIQGNQDKPILMSKVKMVIKERDA